MKLFEYMGKDIFSQYGIAVPRGRMVKHARDAAEVAAEINSEVVVKSQILSGKRGKGGGIIFASTPESAREATEKLLRHTVRGLKVETVLIEEKIPIEKEYYLAITIDGAAKKPVLIASASGGVDIEEVPGDEIIKLHMDTVVLGLQTFMAREMARRLSLDGQQAKDFARIVLALYKIFKEKDAELVEINPLVLSKGLFVAADAKITIDDEALYRQRTLPYVEERTESEKKAHEHGLSYVELDGNIAVMANGAGITMATLDMIQHYGGKPANFMDAGGGTGKEGTAAALEILLSTNPKVILINIFGGITRCDDVASALADVNRDLGIPVPVVIRLVGTNEDMGLEILHKNKFEAYRNMSDAVMKAVEIAGQ